MNHMKKNNYLPMMLNLMLIIFCFYNCNTGLNIQNLENIDSENLSLMGEWTVDAVKTQEVNDRIEHSKIVFEKDENISKVMLLGLEGLDKNVQLNLGISDMKTLSFLESGYMVQFPTICARNSDKVAPKIPYCVIANLIDETLILFSVPEGPKFMSVPLIVEGDFLYLKLNPKEKLFLKKKITKTIILPKEYKNDLEIQSLKGKVKAITNFTYDGSKFEPNPYGNIQNIRKVNFDEFGNYQLSKWNSFGYRRQEITTSYSGTFHDRTISQMSKGGASAYTMTRLVKGTKITTYSSRDTTVQIINDLGVQEIKTSQYQKNQELDFNGNVVNIKYNSEDGGFSTTQKDYSKYDKHNNWLKQISYDITHCEPKRNRVTIRKVEYY
jgi:hypothetical protein